MKCIDAIEGTVKNILTSLHRIFVEERLDDSEYVRDVKAVIEATFQFVQINPESVDDPMLLKRVLYDYSRSLWLQGLKTTSRRQDKTEPEDLPDDDYQTYYFDYLYHHGLYPK